MVSGALTFGFFILLISILRTASVRYEFDETSGRSSPQTASEIDYRLANPGKVLPDSFLWPAKVIRDKAWLAITTNPAKKSELLLLFADKRLASSKILFEKGKIEEGYATLTKAEKYLEEAANAEARNRSRGYDTREFLNVLARASLKHYEEIQKLLAIAPEDARPGIIQTQDYSKRTYENARNVLLGKGSTPPKNPFGW